MRGSKQPRQQDPKLEPGASRARAGILGGKRCRTCKILLCGLDGGCYCDDMGDEERRRVKKRRREGKNADDAVWEDGGF